MDETQARTRLMMMVQAESEPSLSPPELDELLALAKRADAEGLAPDDDDWTPTWDLNSAAAEGWRWKAGKAAPRYGVTLGTETLNRQQMYAHCLLQANAYARKGIGMIGVTSNAY